MTAESPYRQWGLLSRNRYRAARLNAGDGEKIIIHIEVEVERLIVTHARDDSICNGVAG